jgi:hypothetical protein
MAQKQKGVADAVIKADQPIRWQMALSSCCPYRLTREILTPVMHPHEPLTYPDR